MAKIMTGENNPFFGKHHSEETKRRLSLANLSRPPMSEETKRKIKAQLARPEIRQVMSDKARVRSRGEDNPFYGKHHTEETKQKLRELSKLGLMGRKGQRNTPGHNAKISASNKAAYQDPELRERTSIRIREYYKTPEGVITKRIASDALKGRKRVPELVEAHAEMMREYWRTHKHPRLGYKLTSEERRRLSLNHIGLQAGEKCPRWLGGKSLEPYGLGWTVGRRMLARERDHNTCQLCLVNSGTPMDVHHIDYNKKHNDFSNWITLCHGCNARVNINRDFWQEFFRQVMLLKQYKQLPSGV